MWQRKTKDNSLSKLPFYLKQLGVRLTIGVVQKSSLLGAANILHKVLFIKIHRHIFLSILKFQFEVYVHFR